MAKKKYETPAIRTRSIETESFIAESNQTVTYDTNETEDATPEIEHWAKGNTVVGEEVLSDANGRSLWDE